MVTWSSGEGEFVRSTEAANGQSFRRGHNGWTTPCDELRKKLENAGHKPFAATGCTHGKAFTCVWRDRIANWPVWQGATYKAYDVIAYCIELHELEHVNQINNSGGCPPGADVTPFDPGDNKDPWEKAAFEEEIDCYNWRLPEFNPADVGVDHSVVTDAKAGACNAWKRHNANLKTPDPPYSGCE